MTQTSFPLDILLKTTMPTHPKTCAQADSYTRQLLTSRSFSLHTAPLVDNHVSPLETPYTAKRPAAIEDARAKWPAKCIPALLSPPPNRISPNLPSCAVDHISILALTTQPRASRREGAGKIRQGEEENRKSGFGWEHAIRCEIPVFRILKHSPAMSNST
jgi:hypothetical protein